MSQITEPAPAPSIDIELTSVTSATNGAPLPTPASDRPLAPADEVLEASRALDAAAPDGGWQAWRAVLCTAVIAFWYTGVTYSWGVMQTSLVDARLAPASTLAFVGSLAVAMLAALAVVNARLLGVIGARKMAFLGVTLMVVSQVLAGNTTHTIAGLFVTAGVMMGFGVSFCFMVVSIVPAQYFSTKRGTAVGIVYAGGGLGGAVISLAMEAAVSRWGPEWAFRGIGIVMALTSYPAAWFLTERVVPKKNQLVEWSLFKSLDFNLLFLAGALATFPLFVPPFFLPLYAQSLGMSTATGAMLVCVFNFASAAGRILNGFVSDRLLGPLNTLFISLLLTALSMLIVWPTSASLPPLVVFVILNGASNGGFFSIMPTVVGRVLGSQRLSVAFGMIVTGWTAGYLMGAPAAGYILAAYGGVDRGIGAFRPAVFWAGGMAAGAAMSVGVLRWRAGPWRAKI